MSHIYNKSKDTCISGYLDIIVVLHKFSVYIMYILAPSSLLVFRTLCAEFILYTLVSTTEVRSKYSNCITIVYTLDAVHLY